MSAPARTRLPVRGSYRIAPSRSECRFRARGLFGLPVHGTMPIRTGTVTITEGRAHVAAELDPAALATGIRRRDDDVRSPKLLDVANHPVIGFAGELSEEGTRVQGTLTVHGTAVATTLEVREVTRHRGGVDVVATTTVDRHDFGVTAMRGVIGRRVDVTLTISLVPGP
jgi:polyisoprenoid-binding protein YceI